MKKIILNLSLLILIALTGNCFSADNSSGQVKLDNFSNEVVGLIIASVDKKDDLREVVSRFYNLRLINHRFRDAVKCKFIQKLFMKSCINSFTKQDFQKLFIQLVELSARDLNYIFRFFAVGYNFNENLNKLRFLLRSYKLATGRFLQLDNSNKDVRKITINTVKNNNIELVEMLIRAGANVNIEFGNNLKVTLLMEASWLGSAELVKILIDAGANVNAIVGNNTALLLAKNSEIADILINKGATVNLSHHQQENIKKIIIAGFIALGAIDIYALTRS